MDARVLWVAANPLLCDYEGILIDFLYISMQLLSSFGWLLGGYLSDPCDILKYGSMEYKSTMFFHLLYHLTIKTIKQNISSQTSGQFEVSLL